MLALRRSNVAEAATIALGGIGTMQKTVTVASQLIEVHRATVAEGVLVEHDQAGSDERLEFLANTTQIGELARFFTGAARDAGDLNIGGSGGGQFEKTEKVFYLVSANNSARFRWHLLAIRVACIPFSIP